MNEDMRPGLREIYTRLVIDELPMVRRAAALVFTQVRRSTPCLAHYLSHPTI